MSAPTEAPLHRAPRRKERPEPVTHTVTRRDVEGNDLGEVDLEPGVFGIEPNESVLHQVVTAQLAAARAGTHSTRTRAETRGGGAKPYRQKGTGRARQGSIRAAQFEGGGVALGPKPRSYRQRTPKKMVRLALCSALSDRAAEGRVALVDQWSWEEPRTKNAVAALEALGLSGRVLVVLTPHDEVAERSFANLPRVATLAVGELNAHDVVRADWVVFTDETLPGAPPVPAFEEMVVEIVDEETGEVHVVDEVVDEETGEETELQEVDYEETDVDEADGEEEG
ncbi:MAG TPA: 50S ribosomal protein L4 [Acidimicrobiales bacterium]|nr:50S ribosomal protein L4 [Acidimicrobiales bacterium]